MRFNFEFSNLCGTVYSEGNLIFSPDGGPPPAPRTPNTLLLFSPLPLTLTYPCHHPLLTPYRPPPPLTPHLSNPPEPGSCRALLAGEATLLTHCRAPGSLLSPVGNRVTVFDLENSKSVTLPFEN
ncbi:hypothetical protein T484DRAFT_1757232, partial [Baffinella frigidus]